MWLSGRSDAAATLDAIGRSAAIIEFDMDGGILSANARFLDLMGYTAAELRGQHHRLFLDESERDSAAYRAFWDSLRRGEAQVARFRRRRKGGETVWIEASYNPVPGRRGTPVKVTKLATDITLQHRQFIDFRGQVAAIQRSQSVVEFAPDGTILTANARFLNLMGYALEEVAGRPHAMFVDDAERESAAYRAFWERLRRGEYHAAQFRRVGKDGREVWIEGSYNPVLDDDGRTLKVVKYATDVTERMRLLRHLNTLIAQNFAAITGATDRSAGSARQTAEAVQRSSGQIQSMAAGTEELAASVREIAAMMTRATAATEAVAARVQQAETAIRRLAETAAAVGGVVALIRGIASQIDLLALNATIESARAGAAGKGFAVVAGEVKNLARQAGDSTNRIATLIEPLQAVATDVAAALQGIGGAAEQLREYVAASAAAVEEQSAVTQDLSSGMQGTATMILAINDNMEAISAAVGEVAHAVDDTREAAQVLVR